MPAADSTPAFHQPEHDHAKCMAEAMRRAEQLCARRGLRLTPLRRRVLEFIWANHKPTKAYDLLDRLRGEHAGAAPPTIYRALDFLREAGLVHQIESLNAFVGCEAAHSGRTPQFLICRGCGRVAEIASDTITRTIDREASAVGFKPERETIELYGLCGICGQSAPPGRCLDA